MSFNRQCNPSDSGVIVPALHLSGKFMRIVLQHSILQQTAWVIHLGVYLAAIPTNPHYPPECSHRVGSNSTVGKGVVVCCRHHYANGLLIAINRDLCISCCGAVAGEASKDRAGCPRASHVAFLHYQEGPFDYHPFPGWGFRQGVSKGKSLW